MTAKSKAPKAPKAPVTISAPKITNAWIEIGKIAEQGDVALIKGYGLLVKELRASQLSGPDIEKAIIATGKSAGILLVSHVEGLTTWDDLRNDKAKGKEFKALPLAKQLATAVASYKLLGVGVAQSMPTVDAIMKENKRIRKENDDARKAKAGTPSTTPKASKATLKDKLVAMISLVIAISDAELEDDATHDAFAELLIAIESRADAFNEVAIA